LPYVTIINHRQSRKTIAVSSFSTNTELTPIIRSPIIEIARRSDQIEQQLTQLDQY